ncbi:MAG: GNAT family N-acetyltransferase [Acidimicrobiia bacterium]
MTIRLATATDLPRVADLHVTRISEGFLSSLGTSFLRRLYRRVLRTPEAFVLVDERDGEVVGFVAGVANLSVLYRTFLVRDGVIAAISAAPRVVRAIPRIVETLKYPNATAELPAAEILAVAVAPEQSGQGIGTALVRAATAEFERHAIAAAKVVTTADNGPAIAMYEAAGYRAAVGLEVHPGRESKVLVWTAS